MVPPLSPPDVTTTTPTPNPAEPRLIDLEVRYTHLEQQFAELSQVVFEQQTIIGDLQRQLRAVRGRMEELGDPIANDSPPHY
jgi:uncharacterized coiled-coil protein SlyX